MTAEKRLTIDFRVGAGLKDMDAGKEEEGRRCPPPSTSEDIFSLSSHYSLRMQPYALIMRFSAKVEKPMKGRAGRASKKPYALYAPLLGVGPFFGLFPFKGTVYGAYGRIWKSLESGLGPTARRYRSLFRTPKAEVHTDPHTNFANFGRKRPSGESIRLRPSLIPLDARAGFCPWKRFFGPSDGLSSFWGIVCHHPIHTVPQGPPRIRFPGYDWK